MKVVSFPDFGCGGIICTLLNKEPLVFYHLGHVDSLGHFLLKEHSHLTAFNRERFTELLALRKYFTGWAGTHCHPTDFVDIDAVDKILYVTVESVESKCLLALRQLEFTHGLSEPRRVEAVLGERWFWPNRWQQQVAHHKVINVDLYDFYTSQEHRQRVLGDIDESVFAQWYDRNNYMPYMQTALEVWDEMLTRPQEYMTV